ncbi:MAG TPA: type II secretion system protein GspI [Gammaproteobacteria bacterium]|nr:type II secretion system protein GspI [Gammaproteobacteria bacterium]
MKATRPFSAPSLADSGLRRKTGKKTVHGFPGYCQGFTLLEVIVALAVIAFSLAAAASAVSNSARNASGLQQRTYAHWVAMNKMTELHVSKKWPSLRTTKGSTLMARHEWFWSVRVSKTPNQNIRRVDVRVRPDENDEAPLVTLTGFVNQP